MVSIVIELSLYKKLGGDFSSELDQDTTHDRDPNDTSGSDGNLHDEVFFDTRMPGSRR